MVETVGKDMLRTRLFRPAPIKQNKEIDIMTLQCFLAPKRLRTS